MEQTALDEYWREMNSADKTSSSNGKNYAPYNVVASYAYLLTNRGTVPTIYYGDLYRTDAAYRSTETPYYEGITKILGLRTKYETGTQSVQNLSDSTADAGSDLIASVRSGTDRASGLAVIIGDNPDSQGTVTINMGKEHANQAYVEALGLDGTNGGQTFVTDKNGNLNISLKGESTVQVHGILDVLRPVGTSVVYRVSVPVYRVYNRRSGPHHYTTNVKEKDMLVRLGWRYEGSSFNAVAKDSVNAKPVYREYNPHNGCHNWTMNKKEHDHLVKLGWRDEGVAWYVRSDGSVRVYRLYNPHSGEHVYTTGLGEYQAVVRAGWHGEGVAWNGVT